MKEGQEVIVGFSGRVLNTEPKTIPDVGIVGMVKEKSNIKIPDNVYNLFQNYYTVFKY